MELLKFSISTWKVYYHEVRFSALISVVISINSKTYICVLPDKTENLIIVSLKILS